MKKSDSSQEHSACIQGFFLVLSVTGLDGGTFAAVAAWTSMARCSALCSLLSALI